MQALYSFEIHGVFLSVYDGCSSLATSRVAEELLNDVYGLQNIEFRPGDIVVDVGAHIGLVSLYLAKRWPFLQIFAFEPHPINHANFARNLRLNNVSNVSLFQQAVTADGRSIMLRLVDSNTGGASAVFDMAGAYTVGPVESVTLQEIFDKTIAPTQRCRLLKIDCEGTEYEIVPSPVLDRVDFLAAEFHEGVLYGRTEYPSINIGQAHALGELCSRFFSPERMRIVCCQKQD
ncbi:MAG TPA: FkbM family methyltransferase [Candidatus Angelobacter sp.]|jgi:FkbM family methyltransferase